MVLVSTSRPRKQLLFPWPFLTFCRFLGRPDTLFLLPEMPRNAVFLKKHLVLVSNILCANWFCDIQSPYQVPINTLPTPTVVGVGRVLIGGWRGEEKVWQYSCFDQVMGEGSVWRSKNRMRVDRMGMPNRWVVCCGEMLNGLTMSVLVYTKTCRRLFCHRHGGFLPFFFAAGVLGDYWLAYCCTSSWKNSNCTPAWLKSSSLSAPAWYFRSHTTRLMPQLMMSMAQVRQGVMRQ